LLLSEREAWEVDFAAAKALLQQRQFETALARFTELAEANPSHAEVHFQRGRTLLQMGKSEAAQADFVIARDLDALRVRADSRINEAIRTLGRERAGSGIVLIDLEKEIGQFAQAGIPGMDVFFDHVHYTFVGNYRATQFFAERLLPLLPPAIRGSDTGTWPEPQLVFEDLALTVWDQVRVWSEMAERLDTPPYNERALAEATVAYCRSVAQQAEEVRNPSTDIATYKRALAEDPADYHLWDRLGNYQLNQGNLPGAIAAFEWITSTYPGFEGGHQSLGLAYFLSKDMAAAEASFKRALKLRPGYTKAEQGLQFIAEGRKP
jgi:tetratricopeptide (TPR) repeat protein